MPTLARVHTVPPRRRLLNQLGSNKFADVGSVSNEVFPALALCAAESSSECGHKHEETWLPNPMLFMLIVVVLRLTWRFASFSGYAPAASTRVVV